MPFEPFRPFGPFGPIRGRDNPGHTELFCDILLHAPLTSLTQDHAEDSMRTLHECLQESGNLSSPGHEPARPRLRGTFS